MASIPTRDVVENHSTGGIEFSSDDQSVSEFHAGENALIHRFEAGNALPVGGWQPKLSINAPRREKLRVYN